MRGRSWTEHGDYEVCLAEQVPVQGLLQLPFIGLRLERRLRVFSSLIPWFGTC